VLDLTLLFGIDFQGLLFLFHLSFQLRGGLQQKALILPLWGGGLLNDEENIKGLKIQVEQVHFGSLLVKAKKKGVRKAYASQLPLLFGNKTQQGGEKFLETVRSIYSWKW